MRLILLFSLLCNYVSFAKESTIRVRLTDNGLHFFSDIGHHILEHEVKKIVFPQISIPITGGPGSGILNVTNLSIQSFKSPNIHFKLAPPNGMGWKTEGGAVKVTGDWKALYTAIVPISISGYVKASAVDIRTLLQADINVYNLRPQLDIDACSMDVESIDVIIGGGVIPWIVNLFRPELSRLVKEEIRSQLCTTLETVLLIQANEALLSLPTNVEVAKNFFLNYRCEKKPLVTNEFVEGEIYSNVLYGNTTCELPIAEMDHDVEGLHRMVHFWISEHIPNCLLTSAHRGDLLAFTIDKDFGGGKFASFLRTSCSLLSLCIGRFLNALHEQYPDQFIDFRLFTSQRPIIVVQNDDVSAKIVSFVDMFINPWSKQQKRLARLVANTTLDMAPAIQNDTLTGQINNITLTIAEVDSTIGHFNERLLMILHTLMKDALEVVATSVLRVGVRLPLIDNVTLSENAMIVSKNGYLRISSDFIYE